MALRLNTSEKSEISDMRRFCVAFWELPSIVVKWYAKSSIKIQELIEILIIENFQKSVYFLFESGSLDSPGGPSSNRRYSITGVLRRRVIMNFTSKGPAEAKSTITLRRIHLIRRPYAKRRGRRETMRDCPLLSKQ